MYKENVHTLATDEEIKLILECETLAYKEMGISNKQNKKQWLYLNDKYEEFNNITNRYLQEKGNINFYYTTYKIILNKHGLKTCIDYEDYQDSYNNINDMMINKFTKSVNKKANNYNGLYINDTLKLIDIIINQNNKLDVKGELLKITQKKDIEKLAKQFDK